MFKTVKTLSNFFRRPHQGDMTGCQLSRPGALTNSISETLADIYGAHEEQKIQHYNQCCIFCLLILRQDKQAKVMCNATK